MTNNITIRAIIIGLILVIINAYWIAISSELWYSVFTAVSLFFNTIFCLFILILINFLIKYLIPKKAFTWQELATMYIMMCMVSTISGHTMMMYLVGALAHPFWFATPENEWQSLFWQYIPNWFTVSDRAILTDYFQGESTFYNLRYIKAWLVPMLVWSGFIFVLFSTLLCINVVIRRRWMEEERLAYPLVQLPVEMMNSSSFFKNRLLWLGFSVSGTITLINGLNILVPNVPRIPVKFHEVGHYFTSKPWDAIGWTLVDFHPFVIGLAYFIPLDLSFSCWFFYILTKSFNPLQSWLSHPTSTDKTAVAFMSGNALFVLFLMAMHRRFTWWQFHPGGYVLSGGSWSGMFYIWNAMLISWAIKYIILKYGGFKAYSKGRPFFFGLVLGDYIIGCMWNILGLIFNMPAYSIW